MATELATPRTMAELNKVIKHDMTPDPEWEETGEMHRDSAGGRWPVYREFIPKRKRVPKRDADGGIVYHLAADGSRRRPEYTYEIERTDVKEFTYMPLGNGINQKNYHFRPSEGELAQQQATRDEKTAISDLGRALRESGRTFSDLLGGVKSAVGLEEREEVPPMPQPEPVEEAATEQVTTGRRGGRTPATREL